MSLGLVAALGVVMVGEPPRAELAFGAEAEACARRHGADAEACRPRAERLCEHWIIPRALRCDPPGSRRRGDSR